MSQDYFESSSTQSQGAHRGQRRGRTININIKNELHEQLTGLIKRVVTQQGRDPSTVLEEIVTLGIGQFTEQFTEQSALTTAAVANEPTPGQSAPDPGKKPADEDEDDPMAVAAQQAAYQQLNEAYGYTPMTAHAVGSEGNARSKSDKRQNNSHARQNTHKQKKKKKNPRRRTGTGEGGPRHRSGSRRRHSATGQ